MYFCSLEKQISSCPYECVYACTFHPKSVLTCTITSISNVAQTTGAIKGPLSINTVSIHRAIMAAIGAFINICITYRTVIAIKSSEHEMVTSLQAWLFYEYRYY